VTAASRQVFGEEHPYTTNTARNLYQTLLSAKEPDEAAAILHRHLLWLSARDASTVSSDLRQIR
jgi:hypothetical protein